VHVIRKETATHHRPDRAGVAATLALAAAVSLVAACGTAGVTGSSGSPAGPTVAPVATAGTTAPPGAAATTATPATTAAAGASAPAAQPPSASLAAEGGDPVVGQLGSFTWRDGGSDSPWLPGSPIKVGAAEPMTVTIGDGVAVSGWSARRVAAGTNDGSGAVALGSGDGPSVAFPGPGPGTWSVQVVVRFEDGLGSATYYWQLAVS
jgi:hypothetical protein